MGNSQLELLEKNGRHICVPEGISMRPMLRGKRDAVVIEKLVQKPKKYDLVLFVRKNGQKVMHRIVKVEENHFIINGDNCWQLERVELEQIKGIASEYCRKGKWHKVDNFLYKIYVHLWVDLLFIKRPCFYVRDKIKRKLKNGK